jgi:dephospho-CoA kinase
MSVTPAVFALTGGLGSGKSSVAAHYRRRGLPVIDADALAREVVAPGSEGLAAVVREFGAAVLRDGSLDRAGLARIVFADADARARLEAITHPRIQARRDVLLAELGAAGEPLVAYEVPLLFEKGLDTGLRPVVVVSVPEPLQIERARQRDASSEAEVRARLAAQLPLHEKAARADYVIDNAGRLEDTLLAADAVLRQVCRDVGVPADRYFAASEQDTPAGAGKTTRG